MTYVIEQIGGQGWWTLRNVSETLTMMRDGVRVPMGEVLYQGTKAGCAREQRRHMAVYTLMHAIRYIDRHLEFSPANGQARRILENLVLDITR